MHLAAPGPGEGRRRVSCAAFKRVKKDSMQVCVPNYVPALVEVPNVPSEPSAGAMDTETIDWGLTAIGIDEVWRHSRGKGIKVAVLDTGADLQHPDLRSNIVASKDFTGGGSAQDKRGHGTHCAGIVAAVDNDIGVIGVAPKASLLIGKVLGDDGRGSYTWITNGINWAVDQGADIISMSLGGSSPNRKMRQAIDRAIAAGIVVVAAAGNDNLDSQDNIGYPGNYPEVICVGSINRRGRRSQFSSVGMNIDIMAPGSSVYSTWIPPRAYHTISGTSMATPFVSGVCALALAKNRASGGPRINQRRMFQMLRDSATDMHNPGFDRRTGWGLVDVGFIEDLRAMEEMETDDEGEELAQTFAMHVDNVGESSGAANGGLHLMCKKNGDDELVCHVVE